MASSNFAKFASDWNRKTGVTKTKHLLKEAMVKNAKIDDRFRKKHQVIQAQEEKIKVQYNNVGNFIRITSELSEQTEQMGTVLQLCYKGNDLYDDVLAQIVETLKANKQLKERNTLILGNLTKTVKIVQESLKQLESSVKDREEARIYYEHYKAKVETIEKGQNQAGSKCNGFSFSFEKLQRNQEKYQVAKTQFEVIDKKTEDLMKQIQEKADQVLVFLTIKFCKEVQIKWYDEMCAMFSKMEYLEGILREIASEEETEMRNQPGWKEGEYGFDLLQGISQGSMPAPAE